MKLSQETIGVLKSFSAINSNLRVKEGNILESIAVNKSILVSATVEETFPKFALYDLGEFLNVLSLFKEPELVFEDKYLTLTEGRSSTKYIYGDPATFKMVPPEKGITMPSTDVQFKLSIADLNSTLRAAAALKLQKLAVTSEDGVLIIKAADGNNPSANSFSLEVGEIDTEAKFNFVFRVDNLKLIQSDYDVEISSKKIAKLTSSCGKIVYYIALEAESTYK